MRLISLAARRAANEGTTDKIELLLIQIEHPALAAPLRFSTDPTERLSADPIVYCTRSTWLGANPMTEPFKFVLAAAALPSDEEDVPAAASIVIWDLSGTIGTLLRSFTHPRATVHLALVLASSPSVIEEEHRGLQLVERDIAAGEVRLEIARKRIEEERYPMLSFSKGLAPGVHRR
ncbi:hypothetical protein [Frigidibacter oleivorans]|uniref:hypothetical protein n=1 Tax=Frigidibacter oleivorans TaxID=2487129 RepID=UPI000F8EB874|nr:hypothetical protein [Frigidibacter oleivorans]